MLWISIFNLCNNFLSSLRECIFSWDVFMYLMPILASLIAVVDLPISVAKYISSVIYLARFSMILVSIICETRYS